LFTLIFERGLLGEDKAIQIVFFIKAVQIVFFVFLGFFISALIAQVLPQKRNFFHKRWVKIALISLVGVTFLLMLILILRIHMLVPGPEKLPDYAY
jgi:Ni,Fe-hydrogenase I cytochrome b subunit